MSSFAALFTRAGDGWRGLEVALEECESVADLADLALEVAGDIRLVMIEEDDEYAALVRFDDDGEPRVFLSDGHAVGAYPLAAAIADELGEAFGDKQDEDDEDIFSDAPPARESAPIGDAAIVEDLGTPAAELLAMCALEGMLPIDLLLAICERAGCAAILDDLRA